MKFSNLATDNEAVVLGAMILYPVKHKYLANRLEEQDFPSIAARKIFRTIKAGEYNPQKIAEACGLKAVEVASFTAEIVSLATVDIAADTLVRDSVIKQTKYFLDDKIKESPVTEEQCIQYLTDMIDFLANMRLRITPKKGSMRLDDICNELLNDLAYALDNKDKFLKLPFHRLHETIGRLVPGQVVTFAGRPGTGKSAMALQIANHLSKTGTVIYVTLEMLGKEHARRIVSARTGTSAIDIVNGSLSEKQISEISEYAMGLKNDNLVFVSNARTTQDIERCVKEHKPETVIIDSINLMKNQGESERIRITNTTRELKAIAILNQIPIIEICQLNRDAEGQWKTKLSDIKESGSVEEDSDIVVMMSEIEREHEEAFDEFDSAYARKHGRNLIRPGEFQKIFDKNNKIIMLNVAKNRNGARALLPMAYWSKRFIFEEMPIMYGEHYVQE